MFFKLLIIIIIFQWLWWLFSWMIRTMWIWISNRNLNKNVYGKNQTNKKRKEKNLPLKESIENNRLYRMSLLFFDDDDEESFCPYDFDIWCWFSWFIIDEIILQPSLIAIPQGKFNCCCCLCHCCCCCWQYCCCDVIIFLIQFFPSLLSIYPLGHLFVIFFLPKGGEKLNMDDFINEMIMIIIEKLQNQNDNNKKKEKKKKEITIIIMMKKSIYQVQQKQQQRKSSAYHSRINYREKPKTLHFKQNSFLFFFVEVMFKKTKHFHRYSMK